MSWSGLEDGALAPLAEAASLLASVAATAANSASPQQMMWEGMGCVGQVGDEAAPVDSIVPVGDAKLGGRHAHLRPPSRRQLAQWDRRLSADWGE